MGDGDTADQARRLMRAGLSDEAIEARTGLNPLDILGLRARASVEDAAQGSRGKSRPEHRPAGA